MLGFCVFEEREMAGVHGNPTFTELQEGSILENSEGIDRFLLALNLNERLWSIQPDMRISWFEDNHPIKWDRISTQYYFPKSTFNEKPNLKDFYEAAKLTSKIDRIYAGNDETKSFPAIRTAFDTLRYGLLTFRDSIRF